MDNPTAMQDLHSIDNLAGKGKFLADAHGSPIDVVVQGFLDVVHVEFLLGFSRWGLAGGYGGGIGCWGF